MLLLADTIHDGNTTLCVRILEFVLTDRLFSVILFWSVSKPTRGFDMKTNIRTAYILDIDNLCGEPLASYKSVKVVLDYFIEQYQPGHVDQVYCAATAEAAFAVKKLCPGFAVKVGRGVDGSDLCLLAIADPTWLKARFDRVVIGSGDGIFSPLAHQLINLGLEVEIISRPGSLSRSFERVQRCCNSASSLQITPVNFAVAA
jgi:hypothetical protein